MIKEIPPGKLCHTLAFAPGGIKPKYKILPIDQKTRLR
jgi:hypothetical protein